MTPASIFGLRLQQIRSLAKWIAVVVPMAIAVGSLVALFLGSLDRATELRFEYPWFPGSRPGMTEGRGAFTILPATRSEPGRQFAM